MENKDKFLCSLFLFLSLSYFYNLLFQFGGNLDSLLFWILISSLLIIILYEIFYSEMNAYFILIQILTISVLLKLVYQVGYMGLRGSDVYYDYNFLKYILEKGEFKLFQEGIVSGWPMMHLFATSFVLILEMSALTVSKYLMTIISSFVLAGIYLISKTIYSDKKIALFSSLVFATIPQFVHFDNLFIRQTFTIIIMSIFVFLIIKYKVKEYDHRLLVILLIFSPSIVLGHHFTSFLLLILFFIYLLVTTLILKNYKILSNFYPKVDEFIKRNYDILIKKKAKLQMIFFILLTSLIAYWFIRAFIIPELLFDIILETLGLIEIGTPYAEESGIAADSILTVKGKIIYYGFFNFMFLFAIVLLILIFLKEDERKIENISFSIFFYFGGFMGLMSLFVIGGLLNPDRFQTHMWMIGIIPIVGFLKYMKRIPIKKILTVILVMFIFYNVYNIPNTYIEGNPHQSGIVVGEEEYGVAEAIKFPKEYHDENLCEPRYYGHIGVRAAIYDVQGLNQRQTGRNIMNAPEEKQPSEIAIIREDFVGKNIDLYKKKSEPLYNKTMAILTMKDEPGTNKIYDSGKIYVLKGNSSG